MISSSTMNRNNKMMSLTIKNLLIRKIDWDKTDDPFLFSSIIEGELIQLRLNDFPEEPLCTVIWEGKEQNLDDLGGKWRLPKHRGE